MRNKMFFAAAALGALSMAGVTTGGKDRYLADWGSDSNEPIENAPTEKENEFRSHREQSRQERRESMDRVNEKFSHLNRKERKKLARKVRQGVELN